jgi:hypothetical protein
MNNLDKKIDLVRSILSLAIDITNNSDVDVFCDYSGHTNGLSVRVILAGWKAENTYIDYHKIIYLDRCNEQNLEEVIKYLKLIKEEI